MANEVQNQQISQDYLAVSVTVTATAQNIATLIETKLGLVAGSLSRQWREMTVQVDPETSAGATVRMGNSNVGSTVGGVVQKGISLVGQSDTSRSDFNNVSIALRYLQTPTGGTVIVNLELSKQ
jgi:hypothetical protein